MTEKMVYWFGGVIVLALLIPAALSIFSRFYYRPIGIAQQKLRPCPAAPNCICSEFPGQDSFTRPLAVRTDPKSSWDLAANSIAALGGKIVHNDGHYLHAVFISRIFRFADDLELRLDIANRAIQIRSASRVGYSDLGANRKRMEQLRQLYGTP